MVAVTYNYSKIVVGSQYNVLAFNNAEWSPVTAGITRASGITRSNAVQDGIDDSRRKIFRGRGNKTREEGVKEDGTGYQVNHKLRGHVCANLAARFGALVHTGELLRAGNDHTSNKRLEDLRVGFQFAHHFERQGFKVRGALLPAALQHRDKIAAQIAGIHQRNLRAQRIERVDHQVGFAGPAPVDGRLAHSGARSNGFDAHGLEAFLRQQLDGCP